jgi:glycosyltransferase involved in cell wall biosynthesis
MRVAVLCQYPFEKMWGGPAIYIDRLTYHISCIKDVELHIITIGEKSKSFKNGNLNMHVVEIPKFLYLPVFIPYVTMLLNHIILKIDPDIVHAAIGTLPPYSTAAALIRNKYPVLLTVHGIVAKEAKYGTSISYRIYTYFNKLNEKYVISKIPNIITVSPQAKDWICNKTKSNIHVIPNGVDFYDIQSIQTTDKLKHPAILVVGGLVKIKGMDVLLNAIPIIIKKTPDLHIYIAGSGSEESKLKKLVNKLNIENYVDFLGFLSGEKKYTYYKSADIYVQPSRYETFGIAILEAMACGKTVVASNVGGIPFLVIDGETGLLFENGNVRDLAEKILNLLNDKELREKMGKAGKKRAEEFTWDKIAKQTVEVYKEILKI